MKRRKAVSRQDFCRDASLEKLIRVTKGTGCMTETGNRGTAGQILGKGRGDIVEKEVTAEAGATSGSQEDGPNC